jgi:hypothetical protein
MAAVALVLGLREAAMQIVARTQGVRLEHRSWGAGAGTSSLVAILFGGVFPLPGGSYPPGDGWHYRQFRRTLALSAAAGTALVAILLIVALVVLARLPGGFATDLADSIVSIGMALLLFDSMIAVGPFQGYNARRMLDYSRSLWVVFAFIGALIFIVVSIR